MATPRPRTLATRVAPGALPFPTRVAAWVVTGPLGHVYGGMADWASFLARHAWARARGRDPSSVRLPD
jgi:hypothetical protein